MDHSAAVEFVKHFRRTGECPTCASRMGVKCPRCSTYVFGHENYCPSCGWTVALGAVPGGEHEDHWSDRELSILQQTIEKHGDA